jgi:phosphoribosyl 1,2-cyclic phosphate phosphodiesterase
MEILLMGTAAAEGLPAPYCDCPTCTEARRRGGRDIRSRSEALIDDDLKIDHNPDTVIHMQSAGRSLAKVRAILFTHEHPDHLYAADLKRASPPSTTTRPGTPIVIYGNDPVLSEIRRLFPDPGAWHMDLRLAEPLVPFTTPMGDTVLPLPARHLPEALLFRITRAGRTLFYGYDSGLHLPETLAALGDGVPLDVALLDCTMGGQPSANAAHLNIEGVLAMVAEMRQRGAIQAQTRIIATHFSHNGRILHDELIAAFQPHGIEVAFDGMCVSCPPK